MASEPGPPPLPLVTSARRRDYDGRSPQESPPHEYGPEME